MSWSPGSSRSSAGRGLVGLPVYLAFPVLTIQLASAYWDVGYHRTILFDEFWSEPHVAVYSSTAALWVLGLWVYLRTWRAGSSPARHGAGLAVLGPTIMGLAAPTDELWHRLIGPDSTIWSPPHQLAVWGAITGTLGWAVMIARWEREVEAAAAAGEGSPPYVHRSVHWALRTFLCGGAVVATLIMLGQFDSQTDWRDGFFYPTLTSLLVAWILVVGGALAGRPGGCTLAAVACTLARGLIGIGLWGVGLPIAIVPEPIIPGAIVLDLAMLRGARRGEPPLGRGVATRGGAWFGLTFAATEAAIAAATGFRALASVTLLAMAASAITGAGSGLIGWWLARAMLRGVPDGAALVGASIARGGKRA